MSLSTLSSDYRVNALLAGTQWSTTTGGAAVLSYSIPSTGAYWEADYSDANEPSAWTPLNSTQSNAFCLALAQWSEIAQITFLPRTESGSYVGDIRIAFSSVVNGETAAWAYVPDSYLTAAGDVWLNPTCTDYATGTGEFATLLHELGHALGFKHPFESEEFSSATLTGAEDSTQYSLMSYTDYTGAGYTFSSTGSGIWVQPTTPMLYDILAMQYLYGANTTTRTGDDTYTVSNVSGELKTIWDAGGTDTFDLSNQTVGQTIDLNEGHFSSLGVQQTDYQGALANTSDNVAIAFDTDIENAIGGSGGDTLIGNTLANSLQGGVGDDSVQGNAGTDTLDGGTGNDTLVGGTGGDTYYVGSMLDVVTENPGEGTDQVQSSVSYTLPANVENLLLTGSGNINGTGNSAANVISGNSGNNIIDGMGGLDTVVYSGARAAYTVTRAESGSYSANDTVGAGGADTLTNIERVQFTDKKLAFDLTSTGNAAQAMEFIGTVAPVYLNDLAIRGTIIGMFDQGNTMQQLSQLALDYNLLPHATDAELANQVYRNVLPTQGEPTADMTNRLVDYIQANGQANFVATVAGLSINVDLVGLQQTGIEYVE